MKIIIVVFFVFITITSCVSTSGNNAEIVEEKIGEELLFPKQVKTILSDNLLYDSSMVFNASIKVVTYVNFDCGYCYKELNDLNDYLASYDRSQIAIILYGYSMKGLSGYYTFLNFYPDFPYPIFIDKDYNFVRINKIPDNDKFYHTFLINSENKIRLIGNPMTNEKIEEKYTSEIIKLLTD